MGHPCRRIPNCLTKLTNRLPHNFQNSLPSGILSGEEIAKLVKRAENSPVNLSEQNQPAGYDVTISRAFSYPKTAFILGGDNSELQEVALDSEGFLTFEQGAYLIELNEITSIPKDAVGILLPRSTLLRNGLDIRSALFDPGYSGQPKVMLVCYRGTAKVKRFSRIGQLVIFRSNSEFSTQYKGKYQGEGSVSK
jgi:deoxycytidine triphosphate deaminase